MSNLTSYRTRLDGLLAAAVDPATWPNELKDEALLLGLWDYDAAMVYESTLTLVASGHTQDVSALTDLGEVLAVAWPWREGDDFARLAVRARQVDDHLIALQTRAMPQAGDLLRVRHTRRHTIDGLAGAAATTVPTRHAVLVVLAAALWAIDLRLRQISENPALPDAAARQLQDLRRALHARYEEGLGRVLNRGPVRWEILA